MVGARQNALPSFSYRNSYNRIESCMHCCGENKADGSWKIQHECKLRIRIMGEDGAWFDRVPAWTKLALQDTSTNLFNGVSVLLWELVPLFRSYSDLADCQSSFGDAHVVFFTSCDLHGKLMPHATN